MASGFDRIARLLEKYQERSAGASVVVAASLLADIKTRVFEKSTDTSGAEIQNTKRADPGTGYSTRPYFTNEDQLVSKQRAPKPSKGGWIELPEGYKSFREFSGRQTDRIDLDYTSILRQGLIFEPTTAGFEIGFIGGSPSRSGGATVIEKANFAEHRNGAPIFEPSEKEISEAVNTFFEFISQ